MYKQLKVSFFFLERNKSLLGIDHSMGTLTGPDGIPKNYSEFCIGFLFAYVAFTWTEEGGL